MRKVDKISCPELRQVNMRVERTRQADRRMAKRRSTATPALVQDVAGRALLVLEPAETAEAAAATESAATPPTSFRDAEFLTHLIATKEQLPQTCLRRRAEPAEAIAAYSAADSLTKHD
jgi:hypothetical protein